MQIRRVLQPIPWTPVNHTEGLHGLGRNVILCLVHPVLFQSRSRCSSDDGLVFIVATAPVVRQIRRPVTWHYLERRWTCGGGCSSCRCRLRGSLLDNAGWGTTCDAKKGHCYQHDPEALFYLFLFIAIHPCTFFLPTILPHMIPSAKPVRHQGYLYKRVVISMFTKWSCW